MKFRFDFKNNNERIEYALHLASRRNRANRTVIDIAIQAILDQINYEDVIDLYVNGSQKLEYDFKENFRNSTAMSDSSYPKLFDLWMNGIEKEKPKKKQKRTFVLRVLSRSLTLPYRQKIFDYLIASGISGNVFSAAYLDDGWNKNAAAVIFKNFLKEPSEHYIEKILQHEPEFLIKKLPLIWKQDIFFAERMKQKIIGKLAGKYFRHFVFLKKNEPHYYIIACEVAGKPVTEKQYDRLFGKMPMPEQLREIRRAGDDGDIRLLKKHLSSFYNKYC